jgi:hypothetical protein
MEESTALLDAPEVEAEEIEGGEETQESIESPESQESTEQTEAQDEPSIIEADGKLKLSGKALETLTKLKAENPKQAREFRAALFDAATLKKEFPEGIREAVALKQELEEIGGTEGLSKLQGVNSEYMSLIDAYNAGDPKFIQEMISANPDAFGKVAPQVMSKFAEVDPDGFSYQVSRVFAQDMAANEVPLAMKLFLREIQDPADPTKVKPGMNGILEIYNTLKAYTDRVTGLASKPPAAKEGAKPEAKTSEVEQREQALTVREFQTERNAVKSAITEAEFKKNLGNRKLPSDKVSTIRELYESALNRAVQATPKHKETVDRYVAAKDRTGYRKYMDGVIRKNAGAAMAAAFRKAGVGDKPGPKAVAAKTAAVKTASSTTATAGFNRVGAKPNHNEVDWQATARIAGKQGGDGKYVLRDGSKVLFQR